MERRSHPRGRLRRTAAAILAATACMMVTPAVVAGSDAAVIRQAGCSDESRWRLKVRPIDAASLRVHFLIAGGASGEKWNIFMDHNDVGFFAGSRVAGDDGLIIVRRKTPDLDVPDTIRATAHNTVTGETCRARATL